MAARKKKKEADDRKGLAKKTAGTKRGKEKTALAVVKKIHPETLKESEEKYRSIFEGANDGIIACDLKSGKFLFINKRMSDLTGYSEKEILKLGVKDLHPPESLPNVLKQFNRMASGEATEAIDIPVMRKDKSIIYCDIGSSFLGKNNKTALLGFFRDVTARKMAEEALRESARRERERAAELAVLFEAVPTPVFIAHDPDCRHITGNRAADELLRNPRGAEASLSAPAEVKPRHFSALRNGHELSLDELPAQRAARGEMVKDFEFSLAFDDGTVRHVLGYGMPLRDDEGRPRGAVHVLVDITERKSAEEELRQRSKDLEDLIKELEAYSYTISHDLRAPLRSIEGFARAITEDYADKLDETGKDYLFRVTSSSRRMSQFIDALLAMSRLTGREIKENTVDLSAIAQVAASELKKKQPERLVEFVISEKMKVKGDINMLRLVIENLFDNAWKFTSRHPSAKIELGVTRIDDKDVYFVRDDGAGFNMEFADKLFSPFRRFHKEYEFPGLGIGLATAYKIINKHGGKIWAESAPEKGATFYFTL